MGGLKNMVTLAILLRITTKTRIFFITLQRQSMGHCSINKYGNFVNQFTLSQSQLIEYLFFPLIFLSFSNEGNSLSNIII